MPAALGLEEYAPSLGLGKDSCTDELCVTGQSLIDLSICVYYLQTSYFRCARRHLPYLPTDTMVAQSLVALALIGAAVAAPGGGGGGPGGYGGHEGQGWGGEYTESYVIQP